MECPIKLDTVKSESLNGQKIAPRATIACEPESNVLEHLHNMGLNVRKPVFGDLQKSNIAFLIHLLEKIISKLALSEISLF